VYGCAMAQGISCQSDTIEAQVEAQAKFQDDWCWTMCKAVPWLKGLVARATP
jgi:hypothetical protein